MLIYVALTLSLTWPPTYMCRVGVDDADVAACGVAWTRRLATTETPFVVSSEIPVEATSHGALSLSFSLWLLHKVSVRPEYI